LFTTPVVYLYLDRFHTWWRHVWADFRGTSAEEPVLEKI